MNALKEIFERDTANHALEIIVDSGVNRILEFRNKNGSSSQFFIVMQAKGRICFTGDMGDYVFTNHNADMLAWFNDNMSLIYIDEKCRTGGNRRFSEDSAKETIKTMVDDFCTDHIYDYAESGCNDGDDSNFEVALANWQQDLYDEVIDELCFEGDEAFHLSAYNLSIRINDSMKFEIDVGDGIDCMEYTGRFKWCVLAMNKVAELYFNKNKEVICE